MCQGCVRDFGKYFFSYWTNKDITGQTRNIPLTPSPFKNTIFDKAQTRKTKLRIPRFIVKENKKDVTLLTYILLSVTFKRCF